MEIETPQAQMGDHLLLPIVAWEEPAGPHYCLSPSPRMDLIARLSGLFAAYLHHHRNHHKGSGCTTSSNHAATCPLHLCHAKEGTTHRGAVHHDILQIKSKTYSQQATDALHSRIVEHCLQVGVGGPVLHATDGQQPVGFLAKDTPGRGGGVAARAPLEHGALLWSWAGTRAPVHLKIVARSWHLCMGAARGRPRCTRSSARSAGQAAPVGSGAAATRQLSPGR